MDGHNLGLYLYHYIYNFGQYILKTIADGLNKLHKNKIALELENNRTIIEATRQEVINTGKIFFTL